MENWVRCVLHFGEAQRTDVIHEIVEQVRAIPRTYFLDRESDLARNRSLITFAGEPDAVLTAAFSGIAKAIQFIHIEDLRQAGSVVCGIFTPLGSSLDDCRELAENLGKKVGEDLDVPVFLHGHAARMSCREHFAIPRAEVRDLIHGDPQYFPDLGPVRFHPTAGSIALSAHPSFAEFDVYLQGLKPPGTDIAAEIQRPGLFVEEYPLPGERLLMAFYLEDENVNLLEILEQVRICSARHGIRIAECDFAGLVPRAIALNSARQAMKSREFRHKILEDRLSWTLEEPWCCIRPMLNAMSSENPIPTAGSAAALSAALAAALTHKAANILRQQVDPDVALRLDIIEGHLLHLVREDSEAHQRYSRARAIPSDNEENFSLRREAMDAGFLWSAVVPLDTMTQALAAMEIASGLSKNCGAFPDIGMAMYLLMAALEGSALTLRCHLRLLEDERVKQEITEEAQRMLSSARRLRDEVLKNLESSTQGDGPQ